MFERKSLFFVSCYLVFCGSFFAQSTFKVAYERPKCFIENRGQFDAYQDQQTGPINYGVDFGKAKIFFGVKGIRYYFLDAEKKHEEGIEQEFVSIELYKKREKEQLDYEFRFDQIHCSFNQSDAVTLEGIDRRPDYFSYTFKDEKQNTVNQSNISAYNKIIYRGIAPGIDLEYTVHPESGLKYALILHPMADIADFQMEFDRNLALQSENILISTLFGNWIDHAPITFYEQADNATIPSNFNLINDRTLGFKLGKYDKNNTVIIDPWTQLPSFTSNWDCVWECDKDAAGNIYAIGGVMPMQLLKYNSAGVLQWTYNTPYDTSSVWLGTLAVDNVGNSFVTAGSIAAIQKINAAGALVWDNPNPGGIFSNDEFWSISFNCDQTKLVVGGTGGGGLNLLASIYDIDVASGNVLSSANVASGNAFGIPPSIQEVRAICASPNGKYYFMTQDTVGAFSQNFNACGGEALFYKIDNSYDLGYKCENYHYDNSGICAIKANNNFYYTQNGANVVKRNLQTGAILATSAIPGGANTTALGDFSVSNSGIDIDNCGNVYVGSSTGVVKYDANLVQLATYPTSFKVYDVHVTLGGDIVAAGSTGNSSSAARTGYIQTFSASACAPMTTSCCDASICSVPSLCITDAPVQLTALTPGGTWSGPGLSATGLFTPSVAGVGNQTITYTLPCGSESITIVVSPCQGLTACIEANGSITVSGGVSPYTWAYYQAAQSTPITNQTECQNCGYTWFFGQCLNGVTPVNSCNSPAQWVNFANGTNALAPNGVTQVQVSDASGTVQVFNIANLSPCSPNPCPPFTFLLSNLVNVSCFGLSDGQATVTATGGAAPYTYSWIPGNLNGSSQTALTAGTYTITATDNNNCVDDTTITITQPTQLQVNAVNITGTQCGSATGAIQIGVVGGSGSYSYAWNPNVGSTDNVGSLAGGAYSVVVTDLNSGCTVTGNFNVPSLGGPVLNNPTVTQVQCYGGSDGSIQVSAGGSTPPYQFSLNNGPAQNTGLFSGLAAGTYQVNAIDATGCQNSLTVSVSQPTAVQINTLPLVQLCSGDSVQLIGLASGGTPGYSYQWNPGGTQSAIWVSPLISSTYLLSATDANSCSVTSPIVVNIIPCGALEWFIPNVFSPNADGVNDVFGISSINGLSQQAMIVNRWGDIMIELNEINQFWDGTTPDGKEAKEGVYFMKYSILGPAGEEQSGHVFFHLLRND